MNKTEKKDAAKYVPSEIEPKWQAKWADEKTYQPDMDAAKSPFYNLMMFPYPSAEGLHVGNMYAFTGADVYGRYQRMQGHTVFEPIGLDGFGIHSENYALKVGSHPMDQAERSEQNFYRQLHSIGNGFDWARTVETWKPEYYHWTQWVFIELFKAGLAYRSKAEVNWCPSCKTVLADEQVIQKVKTQKANGKSKEDFIEVSVGVCERCGTEVEKRNLEQWFFRITEYAERLLQDLDKIDWTEKVKIAQRNWIGKSEGARISFKLQASSFKNSELEVFTTRPDTLHGATFMVVSPEHPLASEISNGKFQISNDQLESVKKYIKEAQSKTEAERSEEGKEKTGVFSGAYAINPATGKEIPIWIADYVLMGYGTGAIMAVPAHDQRDYDFAKKYELPIVDVVIPSIVDKGNPPRAGKEQTRRDVILAIVYDPKHDTYLTLKWKQRDWMSFITGGVEAGEDIAEAAKREIAEETGYTDVSLVRPLGGPVEAFFFAAHKDVNRQTQTHLLLFELNSDKQEEISTTEAEQYDAVWLSKKEIQAQSFRHAEMDLIWHRIQEETAYTGEGVLINSGEWDGWKTPEAKQKAIAWIEEEGIGKGYTNYHLRDWLISRQRYWGAPIPMIYCEACAKQGKSWFTSEEAQNAKRKAQNLGHLTFDIGNSASWDAVGWYPSELPVILPKIEDYRPIGTGQAPLGNHPEFYETTCPDCGSAARRETDVSDTFLDSAWYFFRYTSTEDKDGPWLENRVKDWMPVDQYIGGAEHSVLHLLYSRFVTKVFNDLGMIDFDEPFPKFFAHGLIIKDGAKMSKSKGNVVVPDVYIKKYGADTLRTYLMFLGPYSDGGDFQDTGVEGVNRFLRRVYKLFTVKTISGTQADLTANAFMHRTIKGVNSDISSFRYNTAIAKIMTWYNQLADRETLSEEEVEVFLKLLAPFAPHLTEELYQTVILIRRLAEKDLGDSSPAAQNDKFRSIHTSDWPSYDESLIVDDTVIIAIQVNGKLRDTLTVGRDEINRQASIEEKAKASENVSKFLDGKGIKKVIYVPGKILNFVIG